MTEENTRILKLFYAIIGSSGFVKAGELAGLLQTSERTVKSSMEELKTFACQKGCQIQSVRGKGYRLQVTDAALFEAYKRRLEILFNNVEKKRRGKQNYDVARAIILGTGADREGYIRLEDLAQELFMSDSALKKEMAEVRGFFSSFQLSLISRPGRGMRLTGKEFNLRLCMLELYENHYKTRVFPFRNEAYEKTVADRGDQEEIRRMALGLIRGSRCEFLDIYINRLVDYFLLLRNRRGKLEFEPENEADGLKEELSRGPEYDLARQLAVGLEKFEGYKPDEEEIRGLGHNGHIGFNEPDSQFAPLTRRVDLTESTIEANRRFFSEGESVPRQAYTMGIKAIMSARKILLLVSGADKADILKKVMEGPITPQVPASILQLHPDVTVIADREALGKL